MFYPMFTSDNKKISYFDYYRDIRARYGDRYFEFDPKAIQTASKPFVKKDQQFCEDMKKAEQMPVPDRCQVFSICFPVSCGIQFSQAMASQVQEQIEERIGITNIHRIPSLETTFYPFPMERFSHSDNMVMFSEYEDGICYLYFQIYIAVEEIPESKSSYCMEPVYIWVRCYDEDNPLSRVDMMDETVTRLHFEICDAPPKSLPPFDELSKDYPEVVLRRILLVPQWMGLKHDDVFWLYDTTGTWATELLAFYKLMIARHEKKLKQEANPKKKGTAKGVPVITAPNTQMTFPDVIFTIDFETDVTDDTVKKLRVLMNKLSDKMAKKLRDEIGFEFFTIKKTGDRSCDIAIDFGQCPLEAVELVIKELNANIAGMKSITLG